MLKIVCDVAGCEEFAPADSLISSKSVGRVILPQGWNHITFHRESVKEVIARTKREMGDKWSDDLGASIFYTVTGSPEFATKISCPKHPIPEWKKPGNDKI